MVGKSNNNNLWKQYEASTVSYYWKYNKDTHTIILQRRITGQRYGWYPLIKLYAETHKDYILNIISVIWRTAKDTARSAR